MAGMRVLALLLLTAAPALAQDLPPGMVSAELLPGWVAADDTFDDVAGGTPDVAVVAAGVLPLWVVWF